MTNTMKAIRIHETGGREVLRLEEVAIPEPGPGEARIKVEYAGLNFIDIYQRTGQYKLPLPFTPGLEAGGVVDAVGEGVHEVKVGDRVAYCMVNGAYAEYAVVPAAKLVPAPPALGLDVVTALMVQGLTAHYLAISTFPLTKGHTALIHAAAGGAGRLLVQVAKRAGARVIATVGTEEKAALARSAGADEAIIYTQSDFVSETKRLTHGVGVDVVYDSVGQSTFYGGLDCLKPRGMMVLWGQASGPVGPFDPQILNQKGSLYLTRPSLGAYVATREELLWRANDLFTWVQAGELDVRIDRIFPLAEAAEAHAYIENRRTMGKVLLKP
ncbi:MAG: alcohol dehydrogenase [Caldilinea sp.]|jgi:NADPH2:quinone reductase|nr:quinone oxidoreductase [Caldilinea sp.]GIV67852.1 MAG: alcohol dehydrogenase [Caldilinea sp.]